MLLIRERGREGYVDRVMEEHRVRCITLIHFSKLFIVYMIYYNVKTILTFKKKIREI